MEKKREPSRRALVEKLVREHLGKGPRLRGAGVTLESLEKLLIEKGVNLENLPGPKKVRKAPKKIRKVYSYEKLSPGTFKAISFYLKDSFLYQDPPRDPEFWKKKIERDLSFSISGPIKNPLEQYRRLGLVGKKCWVYRFGVLDLGEAPEPYHEVLERAQSIVTIDPTILASVVVQYGVPSPWIDPKDDKVFYWALKYENLLILKECLKDLPLNDDRWYDAVALSAQRGQLKIIKYFIDLIREEPNLIRSMLGSLKDLQIVKYFLEEKEYLPYYLEDPDRYLDPAGGSPDPDLFVYLLKKGEGKVKEGDLGTHPNHPYSLKVLEYLSGEGLLGLIDQERHLKIQIKARNNLEFKFLAPKVLSRDLVLYAIDNLYGEKSPLFLREIFKHYAQTGSLDDFYEIYLNTTKRGLWGVLRALTKEISLKGLDLERRTILAREVARHNIMDEGFYREFLGEVLPPEIDQDLAKEFLEIYLDIPNYYGGEAGLTILERTKRPFGEAIEHYYHLIKKSLIRREQSSLLKILEAL